jgi:hypothetical protein
VIEARIRWKLYLDRLYGHHIEREFCWLQSRSDRRDIGLSSVALRSLVACRYRHILRNIYRQNWMSHGILADHVSICTAVITWELCC